MYRNPFRFQMKQKCVTGVIQTLYLSVVLSFVSFGHQRMKSDPHLVHKWPADSARIERITSKSFRADTQLQLETQVGLSLGRDHYNESVWDSKFAKIKPKCFLLFVFIWPNFPLNTHHVRSPPFVSFTICAENNFTSAHFMWIVGGKWQKKKLLADEMFAFHDQWL